MVQSYNELALTVVAVQSANYTALPNTIVPCDVSGGAFTVTLPPAPEDRTEIILKIVKQTTPPTAPNALTFNLGGSDVLNIAGGSTSGTLTTLNNAVRLHYSASAAIWYAISTDVPLTALTSAIPASLVPAANNAYNLGSGADYWAAAFIEDLNVLAIFHGVTSTATAAATTTLTINSNQVQVFTGSTTQTVLLPTTSVPAGMSYLIINQSSGAVTVQSSGGNTIAVMGANTQGLFTAQKATPTAQNDWAGVVYAQGKAPIFDNSLEFAGTDGTKFTFPGTSGTVVVAGNAGIASSVVEYTTTQTGVSVPANVTGVWIESLIGPGGGGASGRRGAAGTVRCGGGGGASGGTLSNYFVPAARLGTTFTVTLPAGGSGGAAVTTDDTNGNPGTAPAQAIFASGSLAVGTWFGTAAAGGTNASGTGGVSGQAMFNGSSGGNASTTGGVGAAGAATVNGSGSAGGAGGGITSADSASNGGAGGQQTLQYASAQATGGVVGGASPGSGNAAVSGIGGQGGGGGAASITGAAQAGATPTGYGAGGGGGGASLNGNNSGAGGNGGGSYCRLRWVYI